ncbi:MAG: hypothetical protein K2L07_15600 [Lachnospiraceae bacterium]|nr:hypothetical protein [Lachnospiraceae bacterium]
MIIKIKYLIWCVLNLACALLTILFAMTTLECFFQTKGFRFLLLLPVFALAIKGVSANIEKSKERMEWLGKIEDSMNSNNENKQSSSLFGEE